MDISLISSCYSYSLIDVSPDQLLLDPNNPRIVEDVDGKKAFTLEELATQQIQDYILDVINKEAYHIADLIRSMRSSGFIPGPSDMIVKAVPNTNRYLVLEGNRRTTALKHLLTQRDNLPNHVLCTFQNIKVKEFIFRPNGALSEDTVINVILGKIHIDGPLPWGALEKAHYIYGCYLREMKQKFHRVDRFEYLSACADEVASMFNFTRTEVRRLIEVYRVYQQLKHDGYNVKPHHFTLIDLAVADRQLCEKYFGFDDDKFHLSKTGLERINRLCIAEGKPINNPKDFRAFAKIYKHGTEYQVSRVESGDETVQDVLRRVNDSIGDRAFLARLESIFAKLCELRPTDFRGVNAEVKAIENIKLLVDNKLWPLAKKKLRD